MNNKEVLIVDGNNLVSRAFYSQSNTTGYTDYILNELIIKLSPFRTVVVFDSPKPNFRKKLFEEYKSGRGSKPDNFKEEFNSAKEMVSTQYGNCIEVDGWEADDVIATLCKINTLKGLNTIIYTNDKDFFQLVDFNVKILRHVADSVDDVFIDSEEVYRILGVYPRQVADYLALVGDNVDSIPGVPKVGPKTAVKLISEYGDVDNIINNYSSTGIKPLITFLSSIENVEKLRLYKKLTTLVTDIPQIK
jgi:DNA polymerase-1